MWNYQLGVSPAVQYEVFRFQVSVNDAFGVQVGERFDHTGRVEPGGRIFKRTPEIQSLRSQVFLALGRTSVFTPLGFTFVELNFLPSVIRHVGKH